MPSTRIPVHKYKTTFFITFLLFQFRTLSSDAFLSIAGGTAPDPIQAGELVSFKILKEASSAGDEESNIHSTNNISIFTSLKQQV